MTNIRARQPYARRPAPQGPLKPFLDTELANIQRGVPVPLVRAVFADTIVQASDDTIVVDATAGPITVALPPPDRVQFLRVTIYRVDSSGNNVSVIGVIAGTAVLPLQLLGDFITVQSDGIRWLPISVPLVGAQDVTRSGAVGDGTTDNHSAFITADTAAAVYGGAVYVPPGRYLFAIDTSMSRPVVFAAGAVLVTTGGADVHLNGGISSVPGQQIFDITAGGSVMFGSAANQWPHQPVVVNPDMWGLNGNVAPYDTVAVQAAVDSLLRVKLLRDVYVDTVEIGSSGQFVDDGPYRFIGIATSARDAVLVIQTYQSDFDQIRVDQNFNLNYTSAIKIIGDASHTNPQFNQFYGITVENCIIGLLIGEPVGVAAYNAPISETTIYSFRSRACQNPIIVNQPNGKITVIGSPAVVSENEWAIASPGTFSYTDSVSLWVPPSSGGGTIGGSEVVWIGGSIENNESSLGYGIRGANMSIIGAIWEVISTNLIEGDQVSIVDPRNGTLGAGPSSLPAFTIAAGATGALHLTRCFVARTSAAGVPFVDGSAAQGFLANLDACDIDGWLWEHNATDGYVPLVKECAVAFQGLTRFRNFAGTVDVYVGQSLGNTNAITNVDCNGDTFPAATLDQVSKGGWTFSTGGDANNKFGQSTDTPDAAQFGVSIDLISKPASLQSATITGPTGTSGFRVTPDATLVARAWVKPVAGLSGQFVVRLNWYNFAGSAASTASTDVLAATVSVLGWSSGVWIPVTLRATVPKDAVYATPVLYADSGLEMRITGLRAA